MRAQAVVRPVAEGDVRVRVAGDVEFPGAGKDALVAVGRASGAQHRLAGPYHHRAELNVGRGYPGVEAAARLTGTLASWGCWDEGWEVPTSGGITQARQRLGYEPMRELFSQVAVPVADELTRGALLGRWRLMSIGGFEWDAPDTKENAAAFGYSGAGPDDPGRTAFPKARVVTVSECASHAVADAAIGGVAGKGAGEQSLARGLYRRLEEDWLLIADRNFYNWADWCTAADSGAALLWRVKADLTLPVLELLPDGSYSSVLVTPKASGRARAALLAAARAGEDLDEDQARYVRVIEYEVPDRDGDGNGEVIALITTITDTAAAGARCWRRHTASGGNMRPGTTSSRPTCAARAGAAVEEPGHGPPGDLRLPAHPLRDQRPDLPGRHRSRHRPRPGQIHAHRPHHPPPGRRPRPFPPDQQERALAAVMADISRPRNLNPRRRHRSYPRVVRRARHNSYRVKRPADNGTRC